MNLFRCLGQDICACCYLYLKRIIKNSWGLSVVRAALWFVHEPPDGVVVGSDRGKGMKKRPERGRNWPQHKFFNSKMRS